MKIDYSKIEYAIYFIRNIGLLIGIPTIAIFLMNFHNIEIETLKKNIDAVKEKNDLLISQQPEKVLLTIESLKKMYDNKSQESSKEIEKLNKNLEYANTKGNSLQEGEKNITNDEIIKNQTSIIEEKKKKIATMKEN